MTFGDDHLRFNTSSGEEHNVCAASLEIEWPPPDVLEFLGIKYRLYSWSPITDEEREAFPTITRGAVYEPLGEATE